MRIAVWNTAFLGDAVLTLPLIKALRETWPQAQIDMYVRAGLGPLFSSQSLLSSVRDVGRVDRTIHGTVCLARTVSSARYDVWLGAHLSPRSSIMAMASGAPMRIGYKHAWHRELAYTNTVDRCFGSLDEIERLLELLRPLEAMAMNQRASARPAGWEADDLSWPPAWPQLWPPFDIAQSLRDEAAAFWKTLPPAPVLGVHPGSVWGTKRWTSEGFASVARQAVDAGATLLVFAGPGEGEVADHVVREAGLDGHPCVRNCAEALSLPQLAAWISRLDCYLTNDSGPMHMAWVQRVPLVAVFGPTVKELGFFPRGETSTVVETAENFSCKPCGLHGPQLCPRGDHACMATIAPDSVWQAVRKHLFPQKAV